MDPEEYRELMRGYHRACAEEIERCGGHVAQYQGDGVLAYFGYPVARENDAQGAVQAGLAIVQAVAAQQRSVELATRVGIHSGLVITEEGGPDGVRQLSVGGTLNIAARLQSLAKRNSVVISDATHQLVRGFFECRDLGRQQLKGLSAPLQVYAVRGATEAQSCVEAALGVGLTPLVGRDDEVDVLLERWRRAGRAGETGGGAARVRLNRPWPVAAHYAARAPNATRHVDVNVIGWAAPWTWEFTRPWTASFAFARDRRSTDR